MTKKPLLFTSKRDDESIEEFEKRVTDKLKEKEWVNEDGSVDTEKWLAVTS